LFHAELAARELGKLTLGEALELAVLYAEVRPAALERLTPGTGSANGSRTP
jgi:hypothetical protein